MVHRCFAVVIIGLLAACVYRPGADDIYDDDIVATLHAEKSDFKAYTTFAISDHVNVVDGTEEPEPLADSVDSALRQQVVNHLTERGYEQVAPDEDPDLGVNMSVLIATNTTVYYPGWWWGSPYYYGGYYWGYPGYGYYYPYYVSSYSTSSLATEMVDLKNAPPISEDDPEAVPLLQINWVAFCHGLFESTVSVEVNSALACIDQAFDQSPYLSRNP